MAQAGIIFERIIMLFLLGLLGFIAGKTKYLPGNAGTVLSNVVVKITTPLLILTTLTNYRLEPGVLGDGLLIYLFGLFFMVLAYGLSSAATRCLGLMGPTANIYKMQAIFGNVIFLAFPLLTALYGEKGLVYAVFYNLANDSLLWTLGVSLAYEGRGRGWQERFRSLLNGNTLAFLTGILWIALGIRERLEQSPTGQWIYDIFYGTLHPLGVTTIYLSMLFIGLMLAQIGLEGILKPAKLLPLAVLSLGKLIVLPGLALVILMFAGKGLSAFAQDILVLQLAMPAATIVPALAADAGSDVEFATEAVFVTSITSLLTIPLVVLLFLA